MLRDQWEQLKLLNLPDMWPAYRYAPPVGTIVHILAMAHLTANAQHDDDFFPSPGGLFAEIVEPDGVAGPSDREGALIVRTMPRSLIGPNGEYPCDDEWTWNDRFPFHLREGATGNGMRLEQPPEDVCDAVRAFVALAATPDNLPIVVDDGWLC